MHLQPNSSSSGAHTQGCTYPALADHMSTFLAQTLFHTSLLANDLATFRRQAARFDNLEMCQLTEQVRLQ